MRQTDGLTVEGEVQVAADAARVWELVSDIGTPARFSSELRRVRWLDDVPALGARFEGYNENSFLGEWRTVSYVVELDAPRTFAWAVVDADGRFGGTTPDPRSPVATWRFDLAPDAGGTRLRHSVRIGPARSGLSLVIDRMPDRAEALVQRRLADLRTGIDDTLRGIKSLAESSAARP